MSCWGSTKDKDVNKDLHACTVERILNKNRNAALGVAIDSMIAGVISVSEVSSFILYFLGTHPEKQSKLREEVLCGEDRKPYMRACIKESLRLVPGSFANTRVTTKSHEAMGYEIPEKTLIVIPQQIVSTMESHYPRATEFIPERWLEDEDHSLYYGKANPFTLLPFGFGIRSCLGQRIVDLMIEKLIANVIKNFEIIWDGPPPKISVNSFNKMEEPNRFVFKNLQ